MTAHWFDQDTVTVLRTRIGVSSFLFNVQVVLYLVIAILVSSTAYMGYHLIRKLGTSKVREEICVYYKRYNCFSIEKKENYN